MAKHKLGTLIKELVSLTMTLHSIPVTMVSEKHWKNWVEPTFQSEKCKFQNLPKIFDSCRQLRLPEWHDKCMLLQARSQGECLEIFDSKLKSSCIAAFVS